MHSDGDEDALGVHAVEDIAEALALLADAVLDRHRHVVEEELGRRMIDHGADGPDGEAVSDRLAHVDQQHGHAVGRLLRFLARRRAAQQKHQVGMFGAADPDLLAVDDVAVALAPREGADARRIGAAGRLGDAERLQAQCAGGDLRQISGLLLGAAVPQHRAHRVHLRVAGGAIAARAMDLLEDRRRGAQAQSRPAIFLGNQDGEKTFLRQTFDEGGRIGALAVERAPVFAGKIAAELGDRVANLGMVGRRARGHSRLSPCRWLMRVAASRACLRGAPQVAARSKTALSVMHDWA